MIHRLRMTLAEYGYDEDRAEGFLDALMETHPEAGPVVSQDTQRGTLTIVVAVDGKNAYDAWECGRKILTNAGKVTGYPPTELVEINVLRVLEDELNAFEPDLEFEPVAS